jgi:hypothetical protein
MGSFRAGNVRILSYGPQWLPLGDCSGFGLEGGILSRSIAPFHMHGDKDSFIQSHLVRLASVNPQLYTHANFRNGKPSEIWMKAKQEFNEKKLTIQTSFIGTQEEASFAFVFFIEGEKCQIGEKKELYPKTFSRYEGRAQPIVVSSNTSTIVLHAPLSESSMQVIPLSGGKNFWGADFLVAYTIDRLNHNYTWKLTGV